jgi:hypothetical protein
MTRRIATSLTSATRQAAARAFASRRCPLQTDCKSMIWVAPPERDTATDAPEKRLWDSADEFRANASLKAQEYAGPVPGITIQNHFRGARDLLLSRLLSGQKELEAEVA